MLSSCLTWTVDSRPRILTLGVKFCVESDVERSKALKFFIYTSEDVKNERTIERCYVMRFCSTINSNWKLAKFLACTVGLLHIGTSCCTDYQSSWRSGNPFHNGDQEIMQFWISWKSWDNPMNLCYQTNQTAIYHRGSFPYFLPLRWRIWVFSTSTSDSMQKNHH